jgi:ubiquinone/menaquinone biosynthesis C-methylase UbiE
MNVASVEEEEMSQAALADPAYVLGRSEAEARRLMLQAQIYDRVTRRFLADAGITAGMTVLDVGSGAGDVAFAAADLVSPTGFVVGVDIDPAVLEIASARARAEQRQNVRFVAGDCRAASLPDDFDAAVGRLVLMYTGDVKEALRAIAGRVKPGGVVAFAEFDFTSALGYMRASGNELAGSLWEWAAQAFARSGAHTAMAGPLSGAFVAAGLGVPELALHAPLGGGEGWVPPHFAACSRPWSRWGSSARRIWPWTAWLCAAAPRSPRRVFPSCCRLWSRRGPASHSPSEILSTYLPSSS